MISGVVAGFPQARSSVLTVDSATRRYNAYSWVSAPGQVGSTTPANLSVVPGAGSAPGALGEILSLQFAAGSGGLGSLALYVRGNGSTSTTPGSFASRDAVPFTTMTIDGVAYQKANAAFDSGYILRFNNVPDPFGGTSLTHSILFT